MQAFSPQTIIPTTMLDSPHRSPHFFLHGQDLVHSRCFRTHCVTEKTEPHGVVPGEQNCRIGLAPEEMQLALAGELTRPGTQPMTTAEEGGLEPGPSGKLGHSRASFCSSIPRLGPVLKSWFPTRWPWGVKAVMWAEGKVIKEAAEGRVNDLTNIFYFLFGPYSPRQSQPASGKPKLHLQDELSELPNTFPVTDLLARAQDAGPGKQTG